MTNDDDGLTPAQQRAMKVIIFMAMLVMATSAVALLSMAAMFLKIAFGG